MRPTLYAKDEDYRLSFLHGNFVTLTNMKEWEIKRVVEQRLSPIYLSVHSTNPETRRRLLRSRKETGYLPILDYFRDNNITMHTQVVLCPGYNDGDDLEGTIRDLAAFPPGGAVAGRRAAGDDRPPGRSGPARSGDAGDGGGLLRQIERHQRDFQARWGIRFVYLADEWYRLLGRPVPPEPHYDGFPQLENGIGMTRVFLNRLARQRRVFPWRDEREAPGHRRHRKPVSADSRTRAVGQTRAHRRAVEVSVTGVENEFPWA